MSTADRGKDAEKAVAKVLTRFSSEITAFDWHRQYDARSAGGRFPAQPGDFAFYGVDVHGLIEAKEVEHDYRLPKKNLNNEQIAKLYKRELAGGRICILINFTTSKLWRLVPLTYFRQNLDVPSWDLSEFATYTKAAEALDTWFIRERIH